MRLLLKWNHKSFSPVHSLLLMQHSLWLLNLSDNSNTQPNKVLSPPTSEELRQPSHIWLSRLRDNKTKGIWNGFTLLLFAGKRDAHMRYVTTNKVIHRDIVQRDEASPLPIKLPFLAIRLLWVYNPWHKILKLNLHFFFFFRNKFLNCLDWSMAPKSPNNPARILWHWMLHSLHYSNNLKVTAKVIWLTIF